MACGNGTCTPCALLSGIYTVSLAWFEWHLEYPPTRWPWWGRLITTPPPARMTSDDWAVATGKGGGTDENCVARAAHINHQASGVLVCTVLPLLPARSYRLCSVVACTRYLAIVVATGDLALRPSSTLYYMW